MASYSAVNHPYQDTGYNESQAGFITPGVSPWIKFGIPVAILVIAGAVVGAIFGVKASKNNSSGGSGGAAAAASAKLEVGRFATATAQEFMMPIYPSATNAAAYSTPTYTNDANLAWPQDSFKPSNPSATSVRQDRPRLIAPAYMWAALPSRIAADPYLKGWNDTIFQNASDYANRPAVAYFMDGDSGILDNAREIKMRVKAFAYWADLAWRELANAASSDFGPDTDDKWNPTHFLDVAEFSAAYAIGYDWLHDQWSDDQKATLRANLIKYGLNLGVAAYTDATRGPAIGWWKTNIQGNWNCVCNGGLTLASLAILGDDNSGIAEQLLGLTVDNAKTNCANAVTSDGTWTETPNYWYFGTTGHAEMAASLISATGSDYGLLDANKNFVKTGDFHMHVSGPGSLFDWGDHGPNKFSTTANGMFLYAAHYKKPAYSLYQRDQHDAAEPWSMFWYDASITGAFWDGKELDMFFDDPSTQWAAMRSSWTDQNALYTHGDLDAGDFVLDALGTRWAGEFGSADYRSPNYFSNETQDSDRWKYYRKMTEGQNTLTVNNANQLVVGAPNVLKKESSGTQQGSSTVFTVPDDSTAYYTFDMTSAYSGATSMKRGVRMLNKRRQVLIQDDINASQTIQWRMHTNATISVDSSGQTATLTRDGKTMQVQIINPPSGDVKFTVGEAKRLSTDVTPPAPDQENPGISVLTIELAAGQYSLQVLFNPQWDGMSASDFKTPSAVALDSWTLTSHN
ncbi:chondroitin AC/alginate lyase [Flagelloscypha sp. PMI_526]|nr:chondroitin AC/alginate lyase [Flagelloscypha sp. PMI_526]